LPHRKCGGDAGHDYYSYEEEEEEGGSTFGFPGTGVLRVLVLPIPR